MRSCGLFDRFRDGELSASQRQQFEAHLSGCPGCVERMRLLDNIVRALRSSPSEVPLGLSERIAREAFHRPQAWESMVVSWLKPVPALIVLTVMVFLFSSFWLKGGLNRIESYGEFEALLNETYSVIPGSGVGQVHTDDDLIGLLEQEGGAR